MPRLDDMQSGTINGLQQFGFSAQKIWERDDADTEYTLAVVASDATGSLMGFEDKLLKMEQDVVESCKKAPRADNLLLRATRFSSMFQDNIDEIHGFKLLSEIDAASYPGFQTGGATPLYDAAFSSIGSVNELGLRLDQDDFAVNGIVFVITDGGDNCSSATPSMVRSELERAVQGEHMESLVSVLVGMNTASCGSLLQRFHQDAGFSHYIDMGDVTPQKIAKLAGFVSQSISSQSQALGSGGPSQQISATF